MLLLAGQPSAAVDASGVGAPTDPCTTIGTPGPDVLIGKAGDDVLCGRGGDDVLRGGDGKDRLLGGGGNDRLFGGDDNDRLRGGPGDDRLDGEGGSDNLRGGLGGDELHGGEGRDLGDYLAEDVGVSLSAGDGANDGGEGEGDEIDADVENLRGGSGNDSLRGSAGANWLHGFNGDDRLGGAMGNDRVYGGRGADTLDGRDATAFTDMLVCGLGGSDAARADTPDHVNPDCENVEQNHAPSDISLSKASVAENQPAATVVGTISATDPDSGDTHTYALASGSGDSDNGSFTVAGSQLRTNAVFDFEAKQSLSVRLRTTDGDGATYDKQFTIAVTDAAENTNPVAVDDVVTATEDTQLQLPLSGVGSPAANDTDPDADALTVTAVANPAGGSASISGGMIQFDPSANLCGVGAGGFDYTVSDGRGGSDVGRVAVGVTCVDDDPTAVDDSATLAEGAAATAIDVLANDTDPDGGPMTIDSVTPPLHGTVAITGGGSGLTYQPAANYCGPDDFTYTLNGGSTAVVSVTVDCFDDPPTAVDDSATLTEDDAATAIDVLANDTDIDGGPMTIESKTDGTDGTVTITGGGSGLTYEPNGNFCGPDSFTYTLNGGSSATVSVTVTCVNDAPVAVNDSATLTEDDAATAIDVLANDTDIEGDPITITAKTDGANGTVTITGGGSGLTYQPAANFCGTDSFTYTLNGGSTATVSVTVSCVNDPPVAVNDSATLTEDDPATAIDVLANDTDVEGDPITITAKTDGANGTVTITGGGTGLTYQPAANFCGSDSFTYTVNGGSSATVSVTVTCVDDLPTAVNDSATMLEDAGATAIDVLANDTDVDGGPISIIGKTDGSSGTVVITGGGTGLTYQPNANFCGSDSFTYTLNGGSTATVSVTVTCVDDPPTAVNDSATMLEDAAATAIDVLANDTDIDGGPKTITATTNGANGTVVITGGGTGLTYQPNANFCGADSFTYTLNGGSSATVSVTVTCVNDAPSFTKGPDQTNVANQLADGSARAYTINPWATGISAGPANESGQAVDFVIDSVTPSNLFTVQPAVSPTGVLTFTTNPATSGTATIVLHIHDNGGTANGGSDASATQSFTIQTVHPPPVAVNDGFTATGNVGINVNLTAEGVLQRGTDDSLFSATISHCGPTNATATAVSGGTCTTTSAGGGNVVLNVNGTFTYNPPAGFTGADHFFYRLTNPGGTSVGDVTVTVSDMIWFIKNDAPACTALASNCGRLANPFSTLAAFQAVNSGAAPNPQPNQAIFIYTGVGAYTQGVTLRNGQLLIGQGAGASITAITGITLAPFSNSLPATGGTRPSLTTSAAARNAITLGSGNTVRGLNIGNKTGSGIAGTNFGTLTLSEVDITGTGQALNLNTGTANATFGTVSSSSGTNGIALTSVAGALNFGSGGTLTGSTGDELLISGGSNTYTYPGAITNTGGNRAVNISGRTGGTITLSGQITDTGGTGDGISLTSNTGATVNLTGGVQLSTGTSPAFTATGGGTVTVTGSANTLTTTTGTALNVQNTTIGSGGLTFQRISSNGAVNGIKLDTTGASGGLVVSSTGSGTCQNGSTAGCTGGVIQSSTGAGISLTNVPGGAQFTRIGVLGGGDDGIFANGIVGGIRLDSSAIVNNGNAVTENGLDYNNVQGISTIQGSDLIAAGDFAARIANSSGTLNLTVNDSDFNDAGIDDGLQLLSDGTSVMRSNITGNRFSNNHGDGFQHGSAAAAPNAVSDTTFKNNTISGSGTTTIDGGLVYGPDGSARGDISNNAITSTSVSALIINSPPAGTSTADFNAIVNVNTIGTDGVADSGSTDGDGLQVKSPSDGNSKISVTNNIIRNYDKNGMMLRASESNTSPSNTQLTATGNQISQPDAAHWETGILLQAGSLSTDNMTMCANVGSNTFTAPATYGAQVIGNFWLSLRFPNAVMKVPNYTGTTFADRQNYFLGRNTGFNGGTPGFQYVEDGAQNMQNNGNPGLCTQPTAPTLPTAP